MPHILNNNSKGLVVSHSMDNRDSAVRMARIKEEAMPDIQAKAKVGIVTYICVECFPVWG